MSPALSGTPTIQVNVNKFTTILLRRNGAAFTAHNLEAIIARERSGNSKLS